MKWSIENSVLKLTERRTPDFEKTYQLKINSSTVGLILPKENFLRFVIQQINYSRKTAFR